MSNIIFYLHISEESDGVPSYHSYVGSYSDPPALEKLIEEVRARAFLRGLKKGNYGILKEENHRCCLHAHGTWVIEDSGEVCLMSLDTVGVNLFKTTWSD